MLTMARLSLSLLLLGAATATTIDILGIPRAAEQLYVVAKTQGKFACLTDKKVVIPFAKVNDNYCDCPDGSDEPGTSACAPHGRFYCLNQGHVGASIPSSKVHDGVCESACCDGSDEAPGVCPNRCAALAAVKAEERAARRILVEGGIAKKKEYVQEGMSMMEARFKELASMQAQKVVLEKNIIEARTQKDVEESKEMVERDGAVQRAAATLRAELGVEKKEKEQLVALYHQLKGRSGKTLKVVLADIKTKAGMEEVEEDDEEEEEEDEVGPSEEKRRKEADELKERLLKRKEEWRKKGTFCDKQLGPVPADDYEDEDGGEEKEDDEDPLFDDDEEDMDFGEEEDEEDNTAATSPAATGGSQKKKEQEELNPILMDMLKVAEQGVNEPLPSAEAARKALRTAEKEEQEMSERIKELQAEGEEDYGSGFEFYLLRGKCFSQTVNKYRYEMCPYQEAQQLEGSATSHGTRLGKWTGMEQVNGTAAGDITFKFNFRQGAKCWNGPERSLTVLVSCGVEDEVVSVEEPSMCEYTMDFRTPAACSTALLMEEEEEEEGEWHMEL